VTEVTEAARTGGYRSGIRFIVDEPIFNGPAISLAVGILVPNLLSLPAIPVVHFAVYRNRHP
jgi:hypothetical protein